MNWSEFQENAYSLTEREIRVLEKEIIDIYTQAEREVSRQIADLYANVLAGVKPEDYYNTVIKYDRLKNLLDNIQTNLIRYTREAATFTQQASQMGISNVYYRQMYAAGWIVPEVAVGTLPLALVELSVYGTQESWKAIQGKALEKIYGSAGRYIPQGGTLTDILTKNRSDLIYKVRQAISNGLIQGKTNKEMQKILSDIIGTVNKDGAKGAMTNALRIVRTETTRTMNAGGYAQSMYLKSKGVEVQRLWSAALDTKTRPTHGALDGQIKEVEEKFCIGSDCAFYPGGFERVENNANCRCRVVDTLNNTLPQTRRGINPLTGEKDVFSYRTFSQWEKEMSLTRNKYGVIFSKKQ